MKKLNPLFIKREKKIKLFLTDVDGVMTNSQLSFFTDEKGGLREIKHFESLDGMGMMYLAYCGLTTGIISRGWSDTLTTWAKLLGMRYLFYKTTTKTRALDYVQKELNIPLEEIAFVGDDLIDLGVLARVGLPLAVANSVPEAKQYALYTSPRHGGDGALRDIAEQILRARGQWNQVVQDNLDGTFKDIPQEIHIVKGL